MHKSWWWSCCTICRAGSSKEWRQILWPLGLLASWDAPFLWLLPDRSLLAVSCCSQTWALCVWVHVAERLTVSIPLFSCSSVLGERACVDDIHLCSGCLWCWVNGFKCSGGFFQTAIHLAHLLSSSAVQRLCWEPQQFQSCREVSNWLFAEWC